MCGIAGYYDCGDKSRLDLEQVTQRMSDAISVRGPDGSGLWCDPDVPLSLAHRRLAIIDLSSGGAQPMGSYTGRYVITYNGEIYNYLDLKKDLVAAGLTFKSSSDTEVLLTAIEQWGLEKTLGLVNGMFAFALWDRQERVLHFARDRMGKKPLYVGWSEDGLVFASELKAFHAHPDFTPEINQNAVSVYMQYGHMVAPHSIYEGVWQIPPASFLSLSLEDVYVGEDLTEHLKSYWSFEDMAMQGKADPVTEDKQERLEQFEELLKHAVNRRMISDVPLGVFLSGGIDSASIAALMQSQSSSKIKSFSIGFEDKAYDEAPQAKSIAKHLGTDHTEFYVSADDALDLIPSLPTIYDEPFSDPSGIPLTLLSKLARDHVTVALSGDGGDELLGGYQRHTHIPALWSKIGWVPSVLRAPFASILSTLPEHIYDSARPSYPQFGRRMHRLASLIGARDAGDLYDQLMSIWPSGSSSPAHINLRGLSMSEQIMVRDSLLSLPHGFMTKVDRATMAASLEARAPLMDVDLISYSWRLPHSDKVQGLTGKTILRETLKKYVPEPLWSGPKMGFNVPIAHWLSGPLKEWAGDLLSVEMLQKTENLDAEGIYSVWQAFQSGQNDSNTARKLWTVLMFQAWAGKWQSEGKGKRS